MEAARAQGDPAPPLLVTGVAGFIGWRTAELLLDQGREVIGIDNLNTAYDARLKTWRLAQLEPRPGFTYHPLDIEDSEGLATLFEGHGFGAVINLAARAGVRASMEDPRPYIGANITGCLNLLEACRAHSVGKFVLGSTSSLYAGQPMPFVESLPVNTPISPYAATKKGAEALSYTWHHLYGLDVSILRFFTVYGPAGRPDMSPLRFLKCIEEGRPLTLYGDGSQSRDFTYIDDIARGVIAALQPVGHEVFNIGFGGTPMTVSAMIERFAQELGKTPIIEREPFHQADMAHTSADITKARTQLGWEPQVPPDEGLRRTAQWYLEHRDWLRRLTF